MLRPLTLFVALLSTRYNSSETPPPGLVLLTPDDAASTTGGGAGASVGTGGASAGAGAGAGAGIATPPDWVSVVAPKTGTQEGVSTASSRTTTAAFAFIVSPKNWLRSGLRSILGNCTRTQAANRQCDVVGQWPMWQDRTMCSSGHSKRAVQRHLTCTSLLKYRLNSSVRLSINSGAVWSHS
jgi:hypothetical protein